MNLILLTYDPVKVIYQSYTHASYMRPVLEFSLIWNKMSEYSQNFCLILTHFKQRNMIIKYRCWLREQDSNFLPYILLTLKKDKIKKNKIKKKLFLTIVKGRHNSTIIIIYSL